MFIQTEATPNPATLKFLPGCDVMGAQGVADFTSPDDARRSPLAERLFGLADVRGVFFGADFIAVTKDMGADAHEWVLVKADILGCIMDHFTARAPLFHPGRGAATAETQDDDPVAAKIRELIETRVRPAVAQDGGDIVFEAYADGIAHLRLRGACSGCPSASATLKHGVEQLLRHYVPEIKGVEAIEEN